LPADALRRSRHRQPQTYAPNARKIHIEIDPSEINKNVKVDVALVADLRTVLERLLPLTEAGDRKRGSIGSPATKGLRGPRHSVAA
jgi:thiamine pyrophosphate-dependent acetolactate synthase large subunit-like protein